MNIAMKFAESSKIDPGRLMAIVDADETASFSPTGILRVEAGNENPLVTAARLIESMSQ